MSSALDPDLLTRLPPDLRAAIEAQMRKALTAEAELRQHLEAENADLRALNDRLEAERKRAEEADAARSNARAEADDTRAAQQLTAKEKAEQCMQARERYGKYTSSHRLYEDLGNGQRRYLSDAEIDAARDGARRAMEELCK